MKDLVITPKKVITEINVKKDTTFIIRDNITLDLASGINIIPNYVQFLSIKNWHIKQEWAIWSKCFGKVFVVNGVSSVGKTTFANFLAKKYGYKPISIDNVGEEILFEQLSKLIPSVFSEALDLISKDDIKKIFYGCKIKSDKYNLSQMNIISDLEISFMRQKEHIIDPSLIEYNARIYQKAQKFIFSGQNVIIDLAWDDYGLEHLSYCFNGYPVKIILLYDSLAQNLTKCFSRNDTAFKDDTFDYRDPVAILEQYCYFYKFKLKKDIKPKEFLLERLDKPLTKSVLFDVPKRKETLLKYLYDTAKNKAHESLSDIESIKSVSEQIIAFNSDEILVVPAFTEFDYIIYSHNVELVGASIEL